MPKVIINKFDGGMATDPRVQSLNSAKVITNFDALTIPHSLQPINATENGYAGQNTTKLQNFALAYRPSLAEYMIFALGVASGTTKPHILMKSLATLDDNSWSTPANNEGTIAGTSFDVFVYYPTTDRIYGARSGTALWSFDPSSVAAFNDTEVAITYTTLAQGLVHSKDDILYIPYDNQIASKDGAAAWNTTTLQSPSIIPEDYYITQICEYNSYLAIGVSEKSGAGNSKVYLWDRDTSLAEFNEVIDAGQGIIKVLEELNGNLICITQEGGLGGNASSLRDRVVFRTLSGNQMVPFNEINIEPSSITQIPQVRVKSNNKIFFLMQAKINGEQRCGVFSIGRAYLGSQLAIVEEITHNNNTAMFSGLLYNLFRVGDFFFISFIDNSTYYLQKTNDQAVYPTCYYESLINPGMTTGDRHGKKKIIGTMVTHEPLESGESVVLKYRVNSQTDGAWTTILTSNEVGSLSADTSVLASGTQFTDGEEYEFRLESIGGATITSFAYKYQMLNELL
jgi:hypothetical protein